MTSGPTARRTTSAKPPGRGGVTAGTGLVLHHIDPSTGQIRVVPVNADTAPLINQVPFEDVPAIRGIPSYHGQRHTPGKYWAATTSDLIAYESYLESQHLTMLDFDDGVVNLSSQALRFDGADAGGDWWHVPDIFARMADGSALVVDVKNPRHLDRPEVVLQARRTAAACAVLGWRYDMLGGVDPGRWANISWLAGFRRPLYAGTELIGPILTLAERPVTLAELLSFTTNPVIARPVVFHLCWHQHLLVDLDAPFRETTLLHTNPDRPRAAPPPAQPHRRPRRRTN
ncbi:TnsA-like heteromeric transposase endonuclease subunit [Actinomadura opuntiae]|uniref:TnsA-like heteromeric transposase endonuclease subunit n=1 Tax=Actinomadura sp. OS1-43 TaxID=604315 RepID=UPI00255A80BC|nr:TnsA-like heteromeric transposase endonuclease subunit [Actinomadura sp. OS1-43]MDL4813147.1 TnsA-like heteromeric transposase endonuclease subunit [Actinomadura sp. OS1-43]